MKWKKNLLLYCKTGRVGECPNCGSTNIKSGEDISGERKSLTFVCADCKCSEHFDGFVMAKNKLYKNKATDKIWWVDTSDRVGEFVFTFDKKTFFNMFADYPHKLSPEQKEIFDKENPFWKDFFSDRE